MKNVLIELMCDGLIEFQFFFHFLCFFHGGVELEESDDGDVEDDEGLEGEIDENEDANFLIEYLQVEGPYEHEDPVEDVESGDDDFVLVVVLEIFHIHCC